MFFDVKNTVSKTDVPLAYLNPVEIKSQDVILSFDTSASIPGNPSPAIGSIKSNTRRFESVSELEIKSPFSSVEVTDIYFYDVDLKIEKPLWYKHTLTGLVFNKTTAAGKYNQKNIVNKASIQALTTKEKIIVFKSEKVQRILPNGSRVDIGDYYINYGDKSLTVNLGTTFNLEVLFETILNNIEISQSDRSRYLIQYEKAESDEYVVTIFTESKAPLIITYTKKTESGQTERIVEKTNPIVVYQEIDNKFIGDVENNTKKIFSVIPFDDNNFRIVVSQNKNNENSLKPFSFRQKENVYTKFYLRKPLNANTIIPWRIILTGNGYIYHDKENNLTHTFNPPELKKRRTIEKITETAEYIDKNTIRLLRKPLWEIDRKSLIVGIEAVEETSGSILDIVSVETDNKIIKIKQDIGQLNRVIVNYRTLDSFVYIDNNLNPIIDASAYNYYHLYYIVPNESLADSSEISVFVHKMPRFVNGQRLIWSSRDFLQYFELNKPFILDEIAANLKGSPSNSDAFLLGIFYIETPVDAAFLGININ
jgi:hypothetical protein